MNRAQRIYIEAVTGRLWLPTRREHYLVRPSCWFNQFQFYNLDFPLPITVFASQKMSWNIREDTIVLSTDDPDWRTADFVISDDNPDLMPIPIKPFRNKGKIV